MDNPLEDVTRLFQAGAWTIVKILFLYFLLPEIVAMILIGGVFRIRGQMFKFLMVGVSLLCFYVFVRFGMPQLTDEVTKEVSKIPSVIPIPKAP